jgi:predicted DNA-binding antitoxin AbrB/MazE fold protein
MRRATAQKVSANCSVATMGQVTIPAKYEDGVFKPLEPVQIKEGTVVDVHVPSAGKERPASIRDLEFTGMWAGREDIEDGVSYVNRLRDNPRPSR